MRKQESVAGNNDGVVDKEDGWINSTAREAR